MTTNLNALVLCVHVPFYETSEYISFLRNYQSLAIYDYTTCLLTLELFKQKMAYLFGNFVL
jgi:hypothetical protein